MQDALEAIRKRYDLPALAAYAGRDGKEVFGAVTGTRSVDDPTPVQSTDAFHIGSCTKAFTATLVGYLVEKGALAWNTRLEELYPRERIVGGTGLTGTVGGRTSERPARPVIVSAPRPIHRDWDGVTIALLLAHRSGLPERCYPREKTLVTIHALPGTPTEQRDRFAHWMLAEPSEGKLGEFRYSNVNYAILGALAERQDRRPFENMVDSLILKPLEIRSAGYGPPPLVRQHRRVGDRLTVQSPGPYADNPVALRPAGGLHLAPADWLKFLMAHASEDQLLRPETLRWLHRPFTRGEYNGGWIIVDRDWAGGRALTHAGSNTMNYSVGWVAPLRRTAIAVMTNCAGKPAEEACDAAVQLLIQKALS